MDNLVVVLVVPTMLLHHLGVLIDQLLDAIFVDEPDRQAFTAMYKCTGLVYGQVKHVN